jgi:hypothetical protein
LKTFPRLQFWKRFYYSMVKGINRVALLNLIDYNKADAMALLQEKLGWTPYSGKHHESLFTKWNQCVYLRCKFGYDKRAIHLSDLILSNQMTRDDAQQRYSQAPISETERKELEAYVTKKLGLTTQEYEQILSDKPRLYIDYPNNNGLIQAYMKLRNKFKKG